MTKKFFMENSEPLISGAILLAVLPLISAAIVTAYELNYLNYYNIPLDFITLDLSYVIFVTLCLLVITQVTFVTYIFLSSLAKKFFRVRLGSLPFILIAIIDIVLVHLNQWFLYALPGIVLGFVVAIRLHKEGKEIMQKTKNSNLHKRDIVLAYIFLLSIVVSFLLGELIPRFTYTYTVVDTNPQMILVQKYGDKIICIPFNRRNKTFKKEFIVLNLGDKKIDFKSETLGKLKPE